MAERSGLLNRRTLTRVPRVRIPVSPLETEREGSFDNFDDHFGVYHAICVAGLARLAKPKALLSRRVWDAEVVTLEA